MGDGADSGHDVRAAPRVLHTPNACHDDRARAMLDQAVRHEDHESTTGQADKDRAGIGELSSALSQSGFPSSGCS